MIAAENGSGDTLKSLIESGADVHAVTKKRETAWDLADGEGVRSISKATGWSVEAHPERLCQRFKVVSLMAAVPAAAVFVMPRSVVRVAFAKTNRVRMRN